MRLKLCQLIIANVFGGPYCFSQSNFSSVCMFKFIVTLSALLLTTILSISFTEVHPAFSQYMSIEPTRLAVSSPQAQLPQARAEDSAVLVEIRAVRATQPISEVPSGESPYKPTSMKVDGRIRELSHKLEKLPFQSFRLMSSETHLVPLKKRETYVLSSGQTVSVRTLYVEKTKVGLWLKWQDQNGVEILDTRAHIEFGESIVLGTDTTDDTGVVLIVDVRPKDKE